MFLRPFPTGGSESNSQVRRQKVGTFLPIIRVIIGKRMLRFRTRTVSLFFAILLTLGATSQCLSALLCEAGFCAEGCAMAASAPAAKSAGKSCCPEKAATPEPEKKSDCCCEWQSGPDALPPSAVAAAPLAFELPFLFEAPAPLPLSASPSNFEPVFGFADSSPPPEPCSSQHDRAPPAA